MFIISNYRGQFLCHMSRARVVLGGQWGDEGKGKLVDLLCQETDVCCRCQGGDNAGHTIVVNDVKFEFHILPSGLINPDCVAVIGSGVVVHLPSLFKELETLETKGLVNLSLITKASSLMEDC